MTDSPEDILAMAVTRATCADLSDSEVAELLASTAAVVQDYRNRNNVPEAEHYMLWARAIAQVRDERRRLANEVADVLLPSVDLGRLEDDETT
jgi:hypothetical protein